jgi:hypothetical protein
MGRYTFTIRAGAEPNEDDAFFTALEADKAFKSFAQADATFEVEVRPPSTSKLLPGMSSHPGASPRALSKAPLLARKASKCAMLTSGSGCTNANSRRSDPGLNAEQEMVR